MNKLASITCKTLLSGIGFHTLNFMDRMQSVNRLGYYDLIITIIIILTCFVCWSFIED